MNGIEYVVVADMKEGRYFLKQPRPLDWRHGDSLWTGIYTKPKRWNTLNGAKKVAQREIDFLRCKRSNMQHPAISVWSWANNKLREKVWEGAK